MNMLLAFAPFLVFAVLEHVASLPVALGTAAALSAVLLVRDALTPSRRVKWLEAGTFALFGGLAVYVLATGAVWSVLDVRLRVDAGLLLLVLATLALRQPFTLQYAKESAPREVWRQPAFLHLNDRLTGIWALAFALMVAADLLMLYVPDVPLRVGVLVTVAAIVGALKLSDRVVARARDGSH